MAMLVKIRGHHLLCLQGYQGYGYNEGFQKNMDRITTQIKNNPGLELEIVEGNDSICACCPFAGENSCQFKPDSDKSIRQMDRTVLIKLNISPGLTVSAKQLFLSTRQIFKTRVDCEEICGDCRWLDKCLWYRSRV